jgi:F0F1-type ATP synthase assembly protein I
MSNRHPPNSTDRFVSHIIVGLAVGLLVARKAGASGVVVGALLAMGAHEMFDAPVADLVADITQ